MTPFFPNPSRNGILTLFSIKRKNNEKKTRYHFSQVRWRGNKKVKSPYKKTYNSNRLKTKALSYQNTNNTRIGKNG